jgi:hypothetical protein
MKWIPIIDCFRNMRAICCNGTCGGAYDRDGAEARRKRGSPMHARRIGRPISRTFVFLAIYSLRFVLFDVSHIFVKIKEAVKLHICPCVFSSSAQEKSPKIDRPPTRRRGGRPPLRPPRPRLPGAGAHAATRRDPLPLVFAIPSRRACSTPTPPSSSSPRSETPAAAPATGAHSKTPTRPSCSKHRAPVPSPRQAATSSRRRGKKEAETPAAAPAAGAHPQDAVAARTRRSRRRHPSLPEPPAAPFS